MFNIIQNICYISGKYFNEICTWDYRDKRIEEAATVRSFNALR